MEIMQRAKGVSDGEIVPQNESYANIKEEVNRRTAKAGYTTRYGEHPNCTKIQTVSGWGRQKINVWPRDKDGHLKGE